MSHWFGSAALIQNLDFSHLPSYPQQDLTSLAIESLLQNPGPHEYEILKKEFTSIISEVSAELIPQFSFMKKFLPERISCDFADQLKQKTTVVPLAVTDRNEARYADVVHILDDYEKVVEEVHTAAGIKLDNVKVHIGGDQLTRERFSGAKTLRSHGLTPSDTYQHLSPITFEFFHTMIAYIQVIFDLLYKEGCNNMCTIYAQKV